MLVIGVIYSLLNLWKTRIQYRDMLVKMNLQLVVDLAWDQEEWVAQEDNNLAVVSVEEPESVVEESVAEETEDNIVNSIDETLSPK